MGGHKGHPKPILNIGLQDTRLNPIGQHHDPGSTLNKGGVCREGSSVTAAVDMHPTTRHQSHRPGTDYFHVSPFGLLFCVVCQGELIFSAADFLLHFLSHGLDGQLSLNFYIWIVKLPPHLLCYKNIIKQIQIILYYIKENFVINISFNLPHIL